MVRISIMGRTVEIPDEAAREIKAFKEECEKAGGKVQIRTGFYGDPGFGTGKDSIYLVCWGASAVVPSKSVVVGREAVEGLFVIIRGRPTVYQVLNEIIKAIR